MTTMTPKRIYGALSLDDYQKITGQKRQSRWLRVLVVVPLLALCTAAGFSGGVMWDGAYPGELRYEDAKAISLDSLPGAAESPQYSETAHRTSTARVVYFMKDSLETLIKIRDEGQDSAAFTADNFLEKLEPLLRDALRD